MQMDVDLAYLNFRGANFIGKMSWSVECPLLSIYLKVKFLEMVVYSVQLSPEKTRSLPVEELWWSLSKEYRVNFFNFGKGQFSKFNLEGFRPSNPEIFFGQIKGRKRTAI
jgi:hypothetical protein